MKLRYCPECGQHTLRLDEARKFTCSACGFVYFHNVAAATVAMIRCKDELLFAVRAHEPYEGMLDLPGGFQEIGESFEEGLIRELNEELGLAILPHQLRYLFSYPNRYPYKGTVYYSCDAYFEIVYEEKPAIVAGDDVRSVRWVALDQIDFETIAFENMKKAIQTLCNATRDT